MTAVRAAAVLVALWFGLVGAAPAAELRVGAGPVNLGGSVTQAGAAWPVLPWLHVAGDVVRLQRSGRAHTAVQAGLEIGHGRVVPDVRLRLGLAYWDRVTDRLGTNCEYHIGPLIGWRAVQVGIHHWSNAGSCLDGAAGPTNAGENALIASWRTFW